MGVREQAVETLTQRVKDIQGLTEQYADTDMPAEEYSKLTGWLGEVKDLRRQITQAEGVAGARDEIKGLLDSLTNPLGNTPQPGGLSDQERRQKAGRRLSDQVITGDAYKSFLAGVAPNGEVIGSDRLKIASPPFAVDSKSLLIPRGSKALVMGLSDTSAGAFITADDLGLQDEGTARRPLTVRDVITVGQTDSDVIEYVRVTTQTNNAAPVAEAVSTVTGAKPESAVAFERVSTTVKSIAHWIPITRRALADAGQMRTFLDGFLRYGLDEELEDQILTGDGTGENFTGLSSTTGVQAQAWDTDKFITTRKARRKVRTVGRAIPNAYMMNPEDWESFELERENGDGTGAFLGGGPFALTAPRLWGLPVIESEAVPAGTAYVGDFRQMVLWDREQAQVLISDSHSDFFIRNILVMLAELRAGFGIFRPSAFVEIDLTAL
jgi:HK97 family phage major capsid protein